MKTYRRGAGSSSGVKLFPNACEVLGSTPSTETTKGHIAEIPTLKAREKDPRVATKPPAAVHISLINEVGWPNFSSCQRTEPPIPF